MEEVPICITNHEATLLGLPALSGVSVPAQMLLLLAGTTPPCFISTMTSAAVISLLGSLWAQGLPWIGVASAVTTDSHGTAPYRTL